MFLLEPVSKRQQHKKGKQSEYSVVICESRAESWKRQYDRHANWRLALLATFVTPTGHQYPYE